MHGSPSVNREVSGGCPASLDSKRWVQASSIHPTPQPRDAGASFANVEVGFQVSKGAMDHRDMPKACSWTWRSCGLQVEGLLVGSGSRGTADFFCFWESLVTCFLHGGC